MELGQNLSYCQFIYQNVCVGERDCFIEILKLVECVNSGTIT